MALSQPVAISVTGAGNQNTGLSVLTAVNVTISAAATVTLRAGASGGTVYLTETFGAAGNFRPNIPAEGLRCPASGTGTWFIVNSAGDLAGGVAGRVN
jgi:hypothetical protein